MSRVDPGTDAVTSAEAQAVPAESRAASVAAPLEEPAPRVLLPRGLVVVLGAAGLVIAVAGMREIGWMLGPMFLALMLVIAVSPVQTWMLRHGVPRWVSTLSILLILYSVILALVGVLAISVAQLVNLLPSYSGRATTLLDSATKQLAVWGYSKDQIANIGNQIGPGRIADVLTTVLSQVTSIATTLFFVVTLMLFMGLDAIGFPERMQQVWQARPNVAQALTSYASGTRRYLVVSSIFGLICSVLDAVALEVLKVPLPLLWAVLAFITNYIPNIGFFIGLVPPAMLALLDGGPREMLLTIGAYMLINLLIQTGIQPRFVGTVVGLSATVTFLALAFWAWALGPLGALLAIPMTLLAKALLIDVDPQSRWLDAIVGSEQAVAAHGRHLAGRAKARAAARAAAGRGKPGAEPVAELAADVVAEPAAEPSAATDPAAGEPAAGESAAGESTAGESTATLTPETPGAPVTS